MTNAILVAPFRHRSRRVRVGESWSATVSWWWFVIIAAAGLISGLLLARIERVRIRQDDPDDSA